MKKKSSMYFRLSRVINIYVWALLITWSLTILALAIVDLKTLRNTTYSIIEKEAEAQYNFDKAFREWVALYGGFYLPVTETLKPSPYLKNVKNRDIVTIKGDTLTLINPARALRMISEYYKKNYHISSHITSKKLLRPENKPDEWENKALEYFVHGDSIVIGIDTIEGDTVFRLIKPLYIEKGCLKCHAQQGYKLGDLRGGISVSIPMDKYLAEEIKLENSKKIVYALIWLAGLIVFILFFRLLWNKNKKIAITQKRLRVINEFLEQRVQERTSELERINKELTEEIRERKKIESVLKISEDRYRGIIESTASCIAVYQPVNNGENFKFIEFNPMAEKVEKLSKEEVLGKLVTDVFPGVVEFGLFAVFQEVYKTGKPQHFPVSFYQDSRIKGYRENYVYKLTSGEVVAVYQDVTEQKRSELLQKILYHISDAVITTDSLHELVERIRNELSKIIDVTNFYVALYNKKTDRLEMPFYQSEKDFITSAPAYKTLSKMVIESNRSMLVDEAMKENLAKAGRLVYQGYRSKVWLGVPLKIEGKVIGVVAVQDYNNEKAYSESDKEILEFVADQISVSIHRKKIEEDLREALRKAEESDRLKSAFLANMSHEIRTPMNGILGFASLLKEPDLSGEEIRKYTDIIVQSGERMLNIINNLVDISKIEAGQVDINYNACDINEQIRYLHMFFYPEAEKKNLKLNYTTGLTDDKAVIQTDSEKLYAILVNLIKNSLKYTHSGEVEFGYRKKGKYLEFYVKDTGIGIPKNRQEAIFDRFVQADIDDKEVYEGAGLGLSITKAFVEMLGGKIWLESVVNQGSCFYFTIPYQNSDSIEKPETSNATEKKEKSVKKEVAFRGIKVLIAEDELVSQEYITSVLGNFVTHIYHARTGQEAVNLFKENPDIDLILMDIKMPEMNGYEATKEIRQLSKEVIIIGQTAYAMQGDREKVIEAGCNDYITKPIDKDELIQLIEKYFNKSKNEN